MISYLEKVEPFSMTRISEDHCSFTFYCSYPVDTDFPDKAIHSNNPVFEIQSLAENSLLFLSHPIPVSHLVTKKHSNKVLNLIQI